MNVALQIVRDQDSGKRQQLTQDIKPKIDQLLWEMLYCLRVGERKSCQSYEMAAHCGDHAKRPV